MICQKIFGGGCKKSFMPRWCSHETEKQQYAKEYSLSLPDYFMRNCTYSVDSKKFEFGYRLRTMEINIKHAEQLVDYLDARFAAWESK